MRPAQFAHQQLEARFSRFKLIAVVFQTLQLVKHSLLIVQFQLQLAGLGQQVGATGEVGDEHAPPVADHAGGDVLVSFRIAFDCRDMHPAFMGEGAIADERSA